MERTNATSTQTTPPTAPRHGGDIIGERLARAGVRHLFTLCGGHISPILTGAESHGIRIVDVRDEVTAVFAADAVARMTGIPGIAAVTAGPGVTNTVTAVKNAEMAQSPLVVFGGATATILKGRGSLQDIDQMSLMKPITKWATRVTVLSALGPTVDRALEIAREGVPGPVFIEVPVDLLYPEAVVREWFIKESGADKAKGLSGKALKLYLEGHLARQFKAPHLLPTEKLAHPNVELSSLLADHGSQIETVAEALARAERPALVIGSQALVNASPDQARTLAEAVTRLGIPTWLGGMARGLLGRESEVQFRHARSPALKEADLVIVAGFPFDFRLGYGQKINRKATLVSVNLSRRDLRKNRKPDVGLQMHPGQFLIELAERARPARATDARSAWFDKVRAREQARDAEIARDGASSPNEEGLINPLHLFLRIEEKMADDAVIIVDGGDFAATASYILRPRGPLCWLDPGVFGTLGVGGGFAIGSTLVRPQSETWLIYGDGSSAYSLAEFDTYARHGLAPIAVIGTDASWAQIARDQVVILGTALGTELRRTAYHEVAEGYGGVGLLLDDPERIDEVLDTARRHAAEGRPVCINVHIERSDFRKGSLSI